MHTFEAPDSAPSTSPPVSETVNFYNQLGVMSYIVPVGEGADSSSFALIKIQSEMMVLEFQEGDRIVQPLQSGLVVTESVGLKPSVTSHEDESTNGPTVVAIMSIAVGLPLIAGLIYRVMKHLLAKKKSQTSIGIEMYPV
jgi:hypothetical protein